MKKKIIGICIGMLMFATAIPAVATINTYADEKTTKSLHQTQTPIHIIQPSFFQGDCVVWDNHVAVTDYVIRAQDDPPGTPGESDQTIADDFQFDKQTDVHWVYWALTYYYCNLADGPKDYHYDWNITFYEDDGTGDRPGAVYAGPFTFADADIIKGEELANSTTGANGYWLTGAGVLFDEPVTFLSDTKYWIAIYGLGPHYPYSAVAARSEALGEILLHELVFKIIPGTPDWTNGSEAWGHTFDMAFLLGGELLPFDVSLSKGLGVTATIKNLLPEPYNQTNITVTFTVTGGFVFNPTQTFFFETLNVSETKTMKFYPIGIGKITIEVFAVARGAAAGMGNTSGFLILFFMI
jgi:hypothetical protein